jgi:hypothetical protein
MDAKFHTGLFEGDSANGVKLSMGITGGDFWARIDGCRNVYRGNGDAGAEGIDFTKVLAVCDIEANDIGVTAVVHEAGKSYVYAVRSVNCAGVEEHSMSALEKISFNENGDIIGKVCNRVLDVCVEHIDGSKIRLSWQYCPINEQAKCVNYFVYSNGGAGEIDHSKAIGSLNYTHTGPYVFESDELASGKWRFCVGAVSPEGFELMSPEVAIDIETGSIPDVNISNVEVI